MWAETITIRVGPHKIGVRTDSRAVARDVRRTFRAALVAEVDRAPSNFSVIRPSFVGRRRGRLFFGGEELTRSMRRRPLLRDLESYIATIADPRPHIPVDLRVFQRDGRAVLADVRRPALMDSKRLRKADITECPVWRAWVTEDGAHVVLPGAHELPLVGIAVASTEDGEPSVRALCARATGRQREWKFVVADAAEAGKLRGYQTADECCEAIVRWLR